MFGGVKIILPERLGKSGDIATTAFGVLRSLKMLFIYLILFRTVTFPTSCLLNDVNLRNRRVTFAYKSRSDTRYVMDDNIIMQYVCDDHLFDDIPLFALERNDFCLHMCALNAETKISPFAPGST